MSQSLEEKLFWQRGFANTPHRPAGTPWDGERHLVWVSATAGSPSPLGRGCWGLCRAPVGAGWLSAFGAHGQGVALETSPSCKEVGVEVQHLQ